MGAFDFENNKMDLSAECRSCNNNTNEECIIAQKIFDQLRFQKCLSPAIIGPARAARGISNGSEAFCEGDVIVPPCNAVSVSIKNTTLSKIDIISKKKNPFRSSCWDVEVKYTFLYTLDFRNCESVCIGTIEGTNSYNQKVTLFGGATGSSETEVTVASDLYQCFDEAAAGPFVSVEGTGVGLLAELKYTTNNCNCNYNCNCAEPNTNDMSYGAPIAINVTLGLFSIIRMFRTTNLLIPVSGNCIPDEIRCVSNPDPCDFFDKLEFPMEIFEPKTDVTHCRGLGNCASSGNINECNCNNNNNNCCNNNNNCCDDSCACNTPSKNNCFSARSKNNMPKR